MIKSAKWAVNDQFKNADIIDEELLSAFAGAEGLINSRSLTYQSADADDVSPITPNNFLFGQLGGQFALKVEEQIYYGVKRNGGCSTLGSTLLEMLDVRVISNIKSKEKIAVSQMKYESW